MTRGETNQNNTKFPRPTRGKTLVGGAHKFGDKHAGIFMVSFHVLPPTPDIFREQFIVGFVREPPRLDIQITFWQACHMWSPWLMAMWSVHAFRRMSAGFLLFWRVFFFGGCPAGLSNPIGSMYGIDLPTNLPYKSTISFSFQSWIRVLGNLWHRKWSVKKTPTSGMHSGSMANDFWSQFRGRGIESHVFLVFEISSFFVENSLAWNFQQIWLRLERTILNNGGCLHWFQCFDWI